MDLPSLNSISSSVRQHQPDLLDTSGKSKASVALVMRTTGPVPEILFIERAAKDDDPWSGQIAFPGGNHDSTDIDVFHTARRETHEEVGVILSDSHYLGRLGDQQGRNNYHRIPLVISCFIFHLQSDPGLVMNHEVANCYWVGIDHLSDAKNRIDYHTAYSPDPYPGVQFKQGPVLWGLTYRFVENFLGVVSVPR